MTLSCFIRRFATFVKSSHTQKDTFAFRTLSLEGRLQKRPDFRSHAVLDRNLIIGQHPENAVRCKAMLHEPSTARKG